METIGENRGVGPYRRARRRSGARTRAAEVEKESDNASPRAPPGSAASAKGAQAGRADLDDADPSLP